MNTFSNEVGRQTLLDGVADGRISLGSVPLKDRTEDVLLAAVRHDGHVLQFIPQPSPAVRMAAIEQSGWALMSLKDANEKECLSAMKQAGAWIVPYWPAHITPRLDDFLEAAECMPAFSGERGVNFVLDPWVRRLAAMPADAVVLIAGACPSLFEDPLLVPVLRDALADLAGQTSAPTRKSKI